MNTPRYHYLDLETDILVGTGPYKYLHFKRDKEVRLERNEMYWAFPGYFKQVIFRIIEDDTARMTAGLAGQFEYICGVPDTYIHTFDADPDFHVEDLEDLCYFYLELYCGPRDDDGNMLVPGDYQYQRNPPYLRRALTLVINYSYIINEIPSGYAVEGTTAVPRTMPGYNGSVVQASDASRTYAGNLAEARQLLIDNAADIQARGGLDISGFNPAIDSDWTGKNILGRSLVLNYHFWSVTSQRLNELMATDFDLIGIQAYELPVDIGTYLTTEDIIPWEIDLRYMDWCPDYLNPYNVIDPLFNLDSNYCFSGINDTSPDGLTDLMRAAISEINRTKQLVIYKNIQSYIYDVNRPLTNASHVHISGWVYKDKIAHLPDLKGINYNPMKIIECWSWYHE
jgi:ABC-type transport system substrate-binding protein